ncbi:hypothetical protein [Neomicrococcus aestuarii]|uniref:Uncharacterized protein n=1 Tax=Neomicrococcus aestuarii TaxID=556325 RepID=A0A1L2ZM85_9MICC|nr:hypothetical protein [Neomicrococcus aestuarii]APF40259.1 hypothetical protein BHE16_03630 [Neomicrococcus aestuarii]
MDVIENLMKASDPAQGISAPGPLILDSPHTDSSQPFIPTFVESPDHSADTLPADKPWYAKPSVWIASVAAAAVVGVVWTFNPFGINANNTLPGGNTTGGAVSSSAPASETSDVSDPSASGTPAVPNGGAATLPNGLLPAHSYLYWEDSEVCNAFDVATVMVESLSGGEPAALNGTPYNNLVVGCHEGYAAFISMPESGVFDQQLQGKAKVINLAEWDGDRWIVKAHPIESGGEELTSVDFFPELRAFPKPAEGTAAERMDARLAELGISVSDPQKLVGPNWASWAPQETNGWTSFDASEQGFTGGKNMDWVVAVRSNDYGTFAQDEVRMFDVYGSTAIQLSRRTAANPDEMFVCGGTTDTYQIDVSEPISLRAESGALAVALVTVRGSTTGENSSVQLIPANAPTSGNVCDLPVALNFGDEYYLDPTLRLPVGFETESEREGFLASQEWKDLVQFAKDLTYVSKTP